jgi:hypothetical protein
MIFMFLSILRIHTCMQSISTSRVTSQGFGFRVSGFGFRVSGTGH